MALTALFQRAAFTVAHLVIFLQFSFLLVTRCVAEECGTRFIDPSSSTVLAQIVVQGKVDRMMPATHHSQTHSANITIGKVYKGMDVLKQMGIPPEENVMVDRFGPETDPHECVADMAAMESEQELLFFLRPSSSRGVLQMTALPLPAEHSVKETVEGSLCDTCVSAPQIQRVMCRQCAHAPTITKGKGKKVNIGKKASIGCYAKGKPAPRFSWSKSGLPIISGSAGVIIKSTNTSSILIIRKAMRIHGGQYICKAENDLGESQKEFVLEVTRRERLPKPKYNVRNAPDKRVCDRVVCRNGGTCYYSPSLDLSFCKCTEGFEGVKCENDISGSESDTASSIVDDPHMIECFKRNVRSICQNGGACYIKRENLVCVCPQGFAGKWCQDQVDIFLEPDENTTINDSMGEEGTYTTSTISFDTTVYPWQNESDIFMTFTSDQVSSGTTDTTPETDETFTTGQMSTEYSITSTTLEPVENDNDKSVLHMHRSNVDEGALAIIKSQIASNSLDADECSFELSSFCENGGTCSYVSALSVAVCTCQRGFTGIRCETSTPEEFDIVTSKIVTSPSEDVQARVSPTVVSEIKHTSTPEHQTVQTTRKHKRIFDNADNVACPGSNICQNGATCYYSISTARTSCICPEGFEGGRCEKSISGAVNSGKQQEVTEVQLSQKRTGSSNKSSFAGKVDDIDDEAFNDILSRLKNSRIKARRCKSKSFCLNKGKCRYIHKLSLQVCLCRTGYTGRRCEISQ